MSLWYDSLGMALYDCGDNASEKAKYILAYLSMPVPRSWWEKALQTGDVRNWASSSIVRGQKPEPQNYRATEPRSLKAPELQSLTLPSPAV